MYIWLPVPVCQTSETHVKHTGRVYHATSLPSTRIYSLHVIASSESTICLCYSVRCAHLVFELPSAGTTLVSRTRKKQVQQRLKMSTKSDGTSFTNTSYRARGYCHETSSEIQATFGKKMTARPDPLIIQEQEGPFLSAHSWHSPPWVRQDSRPHDYPCPSNYGRTANDRCGSPSPGLPQHPPSWVLDRRTKSQERESPSKRTPSESRGPGKEYRRELVWHQKKPHTWIWAQLQSTHVKQ